MASSRKIMDLGPLRLSFKPLEPFLWRRAEEEEPGPAGLCLRLLPLAQPRWEESGRCLGTDEIARLPAGAAAHLADALCAPWLDPREERELKLLEDYLKALADYPNLSCAQCRRQEENGEGEPDCSGCPLPPQPPLLDVLWETARALRSLPGNAAARLLEGLPPRELRLLGYRLELLDALRGENQMRRVKMGPAK